jgi:ADP-ribosylglycohydrolase
VALHERTGRTAGNGSLIRTAPVALAYLDGEVALVEAARSVSELTHWDPEAGDACVLWCLAIRHAILTGELDVRISLQRIDADRRDCGPSGWTSRKRHSLRASRTRGGLSRRCRRHGRRSRPRLSHRMIRPKACSVLTTCAWPSMPRSEEVGTLTPSPPLRAGCLARLTVLRCVKCCGPGGRASTRPRCRPRGRSPSVLPGRDGHPSRQTWCRRTSL